MAQKPVQSTNAPTNTASEDDFSNTDLVRQESSAIMGAMPLGTMQNADEDGPTLPRLYVVSNTGKLVEEFTSGDLLLDKEIVLAGKGEPLEIVVLCTTSFWKERLEYDPDSNTPPRVFVTAEDVKKAGGTTEWVNHPDGTSTGPSFSRAMHLRVLIRKPKHVVSARFFEVPGSDGEYTLAMWDIDKTAYKRVAPILKSHATFGLRERGLHSGRFALSTKTTKVGKNVIVVPELKFLGVGVPEFVAAVEKLLVPTRAPALTE